MRRVAVVAGIVALLGISGTAQADGYRGGPAYAPAYSWSGVYFGSHLGGGWADTSLTESFIIAGPGITPLTQSYNGSGWLAGVHLGAMKQFGAFVTGVELNLDGADINGSASNCAGGGATIVCESKVNWLTTGLSKWGFAWDRWMAYGAVGYAVAGVDHSVSSALGGGFTISFDKQDVAHGIAFGGGLEFAVSRDIMIGVQYLHANLEARGEGLLLGGALTNGKRDLDLDLVTARLSYKFGGDCCAHGPLK